MGGGLVKWVGVWVREEGGREGGRSDQQRGEAALELRHRINMPMRDLKAALWRSIRWRGGREGGGRKGGEGRQRKAGFRTHLKDHAPGKTRPNFDVHVHLHALAAPAAPAAAAAAAAAGGHG